MRRKRNEAYPSGQYQTDRDRSVCMWPGCHTFAMTEVKMGAWGDGKTWIAFCSKHRRSFEGMSWGELVEAEWSRRRKIKI